MAAITVKVKGQEIDQNRLVWRFIKDNSYNVTGYIDNVYTISDINQAEFIIDGKKARQVTCKDINGKVFSADVLV
jgi:hypothetical protein